MKTNSSRSNDAHDRLKILSNEPLWTVEDVAQYLRLQKETVRMMARSKKIPAVKVGKAWRFKEKDIREFLGVNNQLT